MSDAVPCAPPDGWWIMMRECGSAERLPLRPPASRNDPMLAAMPMQIVFTGELQELHRVVDRHARRHAAARRVDVQVDVAVRVVGVEKQHLRDDDVRDVVVDRRAEEDDAVHQQTRMKMS